MQIIDRYSHKDGLAFIKKNHPRELRDVEAAVKQVDAVACLRKQSEEATKQALLYSPETMNVRLKEFLHQRGWTKSAGPKAKKPFAEPRIYFQGVRGAFRKMDGIKNQVGVEIQFGKYAFMGYDIFTKMVLFHKRGLIECGIELVVSHSIIKDMSTGVSSFRQIELDMKERGAADIDIPTLILGIGITDEEAEGGAEKRQRFLQDPQAMIAAGLVARKRGGGKPGPKSERAAPLDEVETAESEAEEEEQDQE
jgi:hypothetical protein